MSDNAGLQAIIQDYIDQNVQPTLDQLQQALDTHIHNGSDSAQLQGQNLSQAPQNAVTLPTGGATIDAEARQAIDDIVSRLQALGLLN